MCVSKSSSVALRTVKNIPNEARVSVWFIKSWRILGYCVEEETGKICNYETGFIKAFFSFKNVGGRSQPHPTPPSPKKKKNWI